MAPRGFSIERQKGDGYSLRTARECLRQRWKDCPFQPEETAKYCREVSTAQWDRALNREAEEGYSLTRDELLTPFKDKDGNDYVCQLSNSKEEKDVRVYGGFWLLGIDHRKGRWWDWTLSVKVGDGTDFGNFITGPQQVRRRIIDKLTEQDYAEFKSVLRAEPELGGLKEVLNKGMAELKDLGGKDAVAYSFVTSPSSERLFNRLGIRVEREHAFLFPHYAWQ